LAHIPKDAKWYLADIVLQITVEGDARSVVHTNLVLIRADSPEEAYRKATELGSESNRSYENPTGQLVRVSYRGLHDLSVIHEELEHGAELSFTERVGMDEAAIQQWVSAKEHLGVFAPIQPSSGPDYGSKEVVETLRKRFPNVQWPPNQGAE
jgi:hypothetical protein